MTHPDIVEAARSALGTIGFALPGIGLTSEPHIDVQRDAIRRLEAAGYCAAWLKEGLGGKDVFVQLAMLMPSSELVFGTAITPIWTRPPMVAHGAASQLGQAFPGRFVLGIGAGYPSQAARVGGDYSKPLTQLRTYVSRLTEGSPPLETPEVNYPTILAALGRAAVMAAGEVADGVMTVTVPPFYVADERAILGPNKLLVVGLNVYLDGDESTARATASAAMAGLANFPGSPYGRALRAMGYTDDELSGGSDRVLTELCAVGSADAVARGVHNLLDAGADHVVLYTTPRDFAAGVDTLVDVAPALAFH